MHPKWNLSVLLLALLAFSGCAPAKDGKRWQSFPVAIYADSSITSTSGAEADLRDGIAFWEAKAGKRLFDYRGTLSSSARAYTGTPSNPGNIITNVISRLSPWPFAASIAGQTSVQYVDGEITGSVIFINGDLRTCAQDCTGSYLSYSGADSERKIITHELGHFLGLGHISDTSNIMNPSVTAGSSLSSMQVDMNALSNLVN